MANERSLGLGTESQQHAGEQLSSGGVNQTVGTGNQSTGIDYNHPLFLSPADVSGIQIISFQLTGIENYSMWNRSMRVALLGRNKLGLIDGSCKKENFPEILWSHWERVNAIVLSWIMNSVSKNLLGGIMYASCAQVVWEDLSERFNKVDDSRSFNLHKEIATLSQGTASVSVYFSKLKDMWEEFEALVPAPGCDCPKSKKFVVYLQKLKLYQFLMGLSDSYAQARSQILMRSPVPTVNQAYAMIISDEGQKSITNATGILGANPAMMAENFDAAMYSRSTGNQRFKKNYNVQCDFCKLKGHTKENCYKIVGYPPDYRHKKKGGTGTNAAYNVMTDNMMQQAFSNYNEGPLQGVSMNMSQGSEDKGPLLNKPGTSQASSKVSTPAANTAGISCALMVSNSPQEWIIDTGATNHMVANLKMLNEATIVKSENPKKIFMPNGDISYVTHTGASIISEGNTITNMFYVPSFKFNLLSVSKLTKELQCSAAFFCFRNSSVGRAIRTDNGTEFINSICNKMFKKYGIIHQTSCAYTPQQNGIAERKHRHILEVTRAIRFQAEIPIRFWGHCVTAAVYLINRLPSTVINNKTPYERLYQKPPSYTHLRDRVFFVNRDVIFREDVFPFKRKEVCSTPIFPTPNSQLQNLNLPVSDHIPVLTQTAVQPSNISMKTELNQFPDPIQNNSSENQVMDNVLIDSQNGDSERYEMPTTSYIQSPRPVPYPISNYISYEGLSSSYRAFISTSSNITEPTTFAEAIRDPKWIEAMKTEIDALQNNNTWEIVTLPEGKTPIGCKWIYKVKYKASGEIERFKARLVAKGYSQKEGMIIKKLFLR
ncbi:PREDICTED: uncharacterized protein LOC109230088 [Nicotiana attenuata]|uniref:uncharacterized protein LOC109230088 n=1 Tax=Nicotiana attenuata TaxID=49451 RepID=UPI000905A78E|nr:PREDICTED: uncharacterized protein LOC109230088 [Nicotiana attenuata]